MGVYIWNKLPSEYQEVEYIESSGTQCIDSLYKPNNNTKIYCKFAHNEHLMNTPVFGARTTADEYVLWSHPSEYSNGADTNTAVLFYSEYGQHESNPGFKRLNNYPQGTVIEFEYSKTGGKYGSQTWNWTPNVGSTSSTMIIFGLRGSGGIDNRKFSGKMWRFTIWESGLLIKDFIPCYRIADGVIGMYDLVNNQFYTNSGTGTFTKGSDVNNYYEKVMKNAYIGEVWTPGSNTVAYFPLKENLNDYSGNSRVLSTSGTKTTIGYNFTSNTEITGGITGANFVCFWIKVNSASGTGACLTCSISNPRMSYYPYASTYLNNKFYVTYDSSWSYQIANGPTNINTWHFICVGYDGSKTIYGIDGVVSTLYNGKGYDRGTDARILWADSGISANVNFSEIIYEKVCWTAEEILAYYNQTKSNYGL